MSIPDYFHVEGVEVDIRLPPLSPTQIDNQVRRLRALFGQRDEPFRSQSDIWEIKLPLTVREWALLDRFPQFKRQIMELDAHTGALQIDSIPMFFEILRIRQSWIFNMGLSLAHNMMLARWDPRDETLDRGYYQIIEMGYLSPTRTCPKIRAILEAYMCDDITTLFTLQKTLESQHQPRNNWVTRICIVDPGTAQVEYINREPRFEIEVELEPLRPAQIKAQFDTLVYGSTLDWDDKIYLRECSFPLAPAPRVTSIAKKCPQLMAQLDQLERYAGRVTVRSVEELFEALRIRQSCVFDRKIIWGSPPRPADYAFRMYQDNGDLTPTYINPTLRNRIEDPRNPDLVALWAYYQARQLWSEARGQRNLQPAQVEEVWTYRMVSNNMVASDSGSVETSTLSTSAETSPGSISVETSALSTSAEISPGSTSAPLAPGLVDLTCTICLDAQRDCLILPCNHLCCCTACGADVLKCPICRCDITNRIPVFVA